MCGLYVSNPNSSLCLQVCKIETGKSVCRIKLTKKHYNLKIMIKKLFIFNLIFIFSLLTLKAQATKTGETELRRQTFDKVWNTVNKKHFDPTFGGVDWQKMREIYQPKAAAAKSDAEFYSVLRQMLGELKLSHFGIIPPTVEIDTAKSGEGFIGIGLKMIDNQAVISEIKTASPAEKSGLKTGFTIEKLDGKTTAEILAPLEKFLSARTMPEAQKMLYRERTLLSVINGDDGTKAKIEVLNAKNQTQIFDVARVERKGEMSQALGNFPPQEVIFDSKILDGSIGYIRFNMWIVPQMPKIREAIRLMKDTNGIIIDLRGNPGGIGGMAPGVAGLLVKERLSLGSMKNRDSEIKFIVYPQANVYDGKIVILTDYGSASTSEIFAAGMQEIERAKVVGERSAGAVLPSVFEKLPNGATFQYVISDYKSPKNILLEGRGVIPDVEVKQTRQALLEGRDLQLEEAVKIIKE